MTERNDQRTGWYVFAAIASLTMPAAVVRSDADIPPVVEFNRDIRPIFSDKCFNCHGPDGKNRKAGLRLDTEAGAFARLQSGRYALVRGHPDKSELFRRITSDKGRMPPKRAGEKLTDRQIQLIRRWIEQGARWQKHWALIPPKRRSLPKVSDPNWPLNPIDYFILARLDREKLKPSPPADKVTLLRRVSLDLTGLPPTPEEVDAFLADKSPDAYEKQVNRLLQSPRFGERLAADWLDAARYADTNGYQSDGDRSMWRWRDWVIDAFNQNMPFDQFTIEQIAGDMLPNPTLDQLIATGFNRNHRGNAEGGIIPEEYAVEYVVDRVETTSTVWLGLTMGCARCHEHKFDPFTQKDFYRLFAYFNNVPEKGKAVKFGNSPPMIKAPTRHQQRLLRELDARLAAAHRRFQSLLPELAREQLEWERKARHAPPGDWTITKGLSLRFSFDNTLTPTAEKKIEARIRDGEPAYVAGRLNQAATFDGKRFVDAGNVADFSYLDKFTLAAWVYPVANRNGAILSKMNETDRASGYSLFLRDGKVEVNLVKRWLDDSIRLETAQPLSPNCWHHIAVTYDGSRVAAGIKVYVDGEVQKVNIHVDELNQDFANDDPLRIGSGGSPDSRFHGAIDDVRIYNRVLEPAEVDVIRTPESISELLDLPPAKRSQPQREKLRRYFLAEQAPLSIRSAYFDWQRLREQRERLIESFPSTMIMQEMEKPRETHILIRGQYDKPGERVSPGVPAALPPLPDNVPNNRLGFAYWLVHPSNPLPARVTVNRFWQSIFGIGLVKTAEDFGSQGEWPSHPDLLDWLATEFIRTGWDIKAIHRLIVTSATYRQSSRVSKELLQKDPDNRLLARGPRFRLPAEMIRDQALFASGLLFERIGGPSVKPYQPEGLWREIATLGEYQHDRGPNLYRRSLYTFWKRTVPPPSMMMFDAAGREMCCVREARTNTALQALGLLNDVTYLEAARVLAQRAMKEAGASPEECITRMFRLATARKPNAVELKILAAGWQRHREEYAQNVKAAEKFVRVGEAPVPANSNVVDLASYTAIASLILNLDETISKE
ncbi:MAG: hypothetical protein KatS3mg105_3757 [Gemmatales bacterium]|nr:MAG: hypothetical protein KatS3mg105_3757 [Gemmatales bacterium]